MKFKKIISRIDTKEIIYNNLIQLQYLFLNE